jgi:predicted PurR-regulated permease PerM
VDAESVDLDPRSILALLGSVAALVILTGFLRSVPRTITAVAIAGLLALALNPVVVLVQRKLVVRRGVAVVVTLGGLFTVFALVLTLLLPPAVRQARALSDDLPQVIDDLGRLPIVGERLTKANVPERVDAAIRALPQRLAGDTTPIEHVGKSVFDGLIAAFITLLMASALLADGERLLMGARRLVPVHRRDEADRLARLAYEVVGRYVAGSISVAGLAGLVNLAAGLALGVPLAPLAALNVVLWNLVPQVGGLFGGLPFVVLGFTKGPTTGVACLVVFLVYMNIENHLIQPLLIGNAVKLSPPATMTAALIGVSAGGVVGALLVIPMVGAAKAIFAEVRRTRTGEGGMVDALGERTDLAVGAIASASRAHLPPS